MQVVEKLISHFLEISILFDDSNLDLHTSDEGKVPCTPIF